MTPATIKIFLPSGDAQGLRIAEISNWSGIAVVAPRTEMKALLSRPELKRSGVYVLLGIDPDSGDAEAYIGEAEVIAARLPQHTSRDFWTQIVIFTSKDENLTKGHIRYLEARMIQDAKEIGRVALKNAQATKPRLPESDAADMEVFLERIGQLLPLFGSNLLRTAAGQDKSNRLSCRIKGLVAYGQRTATGFVVYEGSQAVEQLRGSAGPRARNIRKKLVDDGAMVLDGNSFRFTKDVEFSSPSLAAVAVCGGASNGLAAWKDSKGNSLGKLESG